MISQKRSKKERKKVFGFVKIFFIGSGGVLKNSCSPQLLPFQGEQFKTETNMATYYTGPDNQRDTTPMTYSRESMPASYLDGPVLHGNTMLYMNSGQYSYAFAGNSQQQNNCIEMLQAVEASDSTSQQQEILSNLGGSRVDVEHDFGAWRDGRNEMLVMQQMAGGTSSIIHGCQGLSLSLGTQIPYPNPSPGYSGCIQDSNKAELCAYGMSSMARIIPSSKYLNAAQQLLDEVVNVRKALKQPDGEKIRNSQENRIKSSNKDDEGSKNEPENQQESFINSTKELSHAERQDLQSKLTKLLSMLDDVDQRYKRYYHQMQIVVSSFDAIAGCGAAKPYTALALQTISRHFRSLRDAINDQIQATRKRLGEQDTLENGKDVRITRLRYVDQQLRQQRALQQFGSMHQHAWRPQRGLPESSVTILRAWLFEHFLNPYPKDSDKIMLARQTGLSRSQVSNWFINARVRLWKPMVEDIYKEEFADAEMDSNSSSDNVVKATTKCDTTTSVDRGEDPQHTGSSSPAERCSNRKLMDSKSEIVHDLDITGSTNGVDFPNITCGEAGTEYMLHKLREEQRLTMGDSGIFLDASGHLDGGSQQFTAVSAAYDVSELGRYGCGNGVSLTLGLQHYEDSSHHQNFVAMRGDDMYNPINTSVGVETTDFECINTSNRQQRFSSPQLLHDYVA